MTVNSFKSYAPYGTAWNGIDDDGDWNEWNGQCDANGTCFDWGNTADQGEWGFVSYAIPGDPTSPYTLYHPEDVMLTGLGIEFKNSDFSNFEGIGFKNLIIILPGFLIKVCLGQ